MYSMLICCAAALTGRAIQRKARSAQSDRGSNAPLRHRSRFEMQNTESESASKSCALTSLRSAESKTRMRTRWMERISLLVSFLFVRGARRCRRQQVSSLPDFFGRRHAYKAARPPSSNEHPTSLNTRFLTRTALGTRADEALDAGSSTAGSTEVCARAPTTCVLPAFQPLTP